MQPHIGSFDFSGPTYQIEVIDSEGRSFWTFLQFDEKAQIKDAFCSCEEEACSHLLLAHQKIYNEKSDPLHVRFEKSLFFVLTKLFAKKRGTTFTHFEDVVIEGKDAEFLQMRKKESPETSIKFSNLSDAEIKHWREGRASFSLLYELSFWSDLAKKFMLESEQKEVHVTFSEDKTGMPTHIHIKAKDLKATFHVTIEDLSEIIPSLNTVTSNLQLFSKATSVQEILYDREKKRFHIIHKERDFAIKGQEINGYIYVKNEGFYPKEETSLLELEFIEKENIPALLDYINAQKLHFLLKEPLSSKACALFYDLSFDKKSDLHIEASLFEKQDIEEIFDHYAFIPHKGFFPIENRLFDKAKLVIAKEEIAHFIKRYRVFLNTIPGFIVHLAKVSSRLQYSVDRERSLVEIKSATDVNNVRDFGDWVYIAGQGFFEKAKQIENRTLTFKEVAPFLRQKKEELSALFLSENPLEKRGLHIGLYAPSSIFVRAETEVKPLYNHEELLFFDEFVATSEIGFYELPPAMSVPEEWETEKKFSPKESVLFYKTILPKISTHIMKLDKELKVPLRLAFYIDDIKKIEDGNLALTFHLETDLGTVSFEEIAQKTGLFFSSAGALDLQSEEFSWIFSLKQKGDSFILSSFEFIRYDALFNFKARLDLNEFREFTTALKPSLKGFKSKLRPYQETGWHWLYFLYKNGLSGLLCDDMGLGKTHQAMALMASIVEEVKNPLILIVAPTSVIYHWEDKLATFLPKLKVHLFHGATRGRKKWPKKGIILTSYGVLRVEKEKFSSLEFTLAIFDELQMAKNPHSQIHHALKTLQAKMRIGMTGTPIENNIYELKALLDLVVPGYMPKEKPFKELFAIPIEKMGDVNKKELLHRLVKPFILRRRKQEVLKDLPEKSIDNSYCELSQSQKSLYHTLLQERREALIAEINNKEVPYIHIFSLLSQLKQICDHPALYLKDTEHYKKYESGKWELFCELLSEAIASEQKVVIFSQYLNMLDILENYIKENKWQYATIRGSTIKRKEEIDKFQKDPSCLIFLGSLQAAGVGIDLTAASIVILYDRWWNAARENQAIDRVHRMGQKGRVLVYKLITRDTIEEKIEAMIAKKGKLLEEIVTPDEEAVLKTFTRKELINLLL